MILTMLYTRLIGKKITKKQKKAFTLFEILLIIALLGILITIVIIAIGPRRQLLVAWDGRRKQAAANLEHALYDQRNSTGGYLHADELPSTEAAAVPICRSGVANGTDGCVNLDALAPDYIAELPVDEVEPCANLTGYKVYLKVNGRYPGVVPTHIGKMLGDTDIEQNCEGGGGGGGTTWTWTAFTDEFQINQYETSDQFYPEVEMDANGNFLVIWEDDGQGKPQMRYYDSDANALGDQIAFDAYVGNAKLGMDANGNSVLVGHRYQSGNMGVFAHLRDNTGTVTVPEFQVDTTPTGAQWQPSVAMNATGNFVVTWEGNGPGDSNGIFARVYNASGVPQTGELLVNTTTANYQNSSDVAIDSSGNFAVTWYGYTGSIYQIYAQRFDASGTPVGSELAVSAGTNNSAPNIGLDAAGRMTVVWKNEESNPVIRMKRYDASNNVITDETQVNTVVGLYGAGSPHLDVNDDGKIAVVYTVWYVGGYSNQGEIYGQRYDADGNPVGDEMQINVTLTSYQDQPAVAIDPTGNGVVVWASKHATSSYEVFGRLYR